MSQPNQNQGKGAQTKKPAPAPIPAAPAASAPAPAPQVPAVVLKMEDAVKYLTEKYPDEAKRIDQILRKDILALGIDQAFALRDEHGVIRAFKQPLRLSAADGTLIRPVPNGPYVISAQGYEVWQEASGACVIFPTQVLVDGEVKANNPFVSRDATNRRILSIYARAVAFRFSSKGIPQVSDWTTIFDVPSYRLIDLLAKAKQYPQAFKLLPMDMQPPIEPNTVQTWASYPFDESTQLWVNTAHGEVLQWYAQIINREKKAIDFAQTFAKRNALKHLSGLQKAPADVWTIPVICWRPTSGSIIKWDATTYANLEQRVGNLIAGKADAPAPQIELKKGVERVDEEPGSAQEMYAIDPEDQTEVASAEALTVLGVESATVSPALLNPPTEEEKKALDNLAAAAAAFPEDYSAVMMELGLEADADVPPDLAADAFRRLSLLIDQK